ncbi:MFS transporter [Paraburkholderia sp. MM5482-R1]|uniref:MFS transporter n=1 Tax=unclassified Paraburkholderia TaxID=2615204 RepID=UPI003D21F651
MNRNPGGAAQGFAQPQPDSRASTRSNRRLAIISGSFGNMLEWYDFAIYAYFASIIGKTFFPSASPVASLLTSLAVFGIGYVARPLGSIIIGRYSDKHGRKPALVLTIILMAFSTVAIGLVPPYSAIGIAAPILVTLARVVQGFSSGGEITGSMAFMVEWAPQNRRGLFGSVQSATVAVGILIGALSAAMITLSLSPDSVAQWGWRLPFLFGGVLAPIGFFMRRRISHEAPTFQQAKAERVFYAGAIKQALRAFGTVISWTTSYYVCILFMPTFLQNFAHVDRVVTLWISSITLLYLAPASLFAGYLSDRFGRKPVLLTACAGLIVLPYPLLKVVVDGGSIGAVVVVQLVLVTLVALFGGAGPAAVSELFPTRSRTTLMGIGYGFSTAIFGGFAPVISTLLIQKTGSPLAPTGYLLAAAIVSFVTIFSSRETSKDSLI